MRLVRLGVALPVCSAAAVFATTGGRPWRRLPAPAPPLVVERPVVLEPAAETLDTLRRGETISHLFARHGVPDLDLSGLDPALGLDPRRLRSGLVFSFRQSGADTLPTHISVRTGPEQRVVFRRVGGRWDTVLEPIAWKEEDVRIDGAIDNSLYEALDAQVGDDSRGTWPTSTPGRWISPATSSRATGSEWSSSGASPRRARSGSAGCWRAT
jgi:hypothetical protein